MGLDAAHAWCILWTTNPAQSAMGEATIPTDKFMVCSVTTLAASGVIRFSSSTDFTTGVAKALSDGVITASIV